MIVGVAFVVVLMVSYTFATVTCQDVLKFADGACTRYFLSATRRGILMAHMSTMLTGAHVLGVAITQVIATSRFPCPSATFYDPL